MMPAKVRMQGMAMPARARVMARVTEKATAMAGVMPARANQQVIVTPHPAKGRPVSDLQVGQQMGRQGVQTTKAAQRRGQQPQDPAKGRAEHPLDPLRMGPVRARRQDRALALQLQARAPRPADLQQAALQVADRRGRRELDQLAREQAGRAMLPVLAEVVLASRIRQRPSS